MKKFKYLIFLSFLVSFISPSLFAFVSLQSTASSGFYRDAEQESHVPAYFYWNYTQSLGATELLLNFGVNNNVVQDYWKFYVYSATWSIPLSQGFEDAPFRKSRIQLGRQLFSETFQLSAFDGIQVPLYWSSTGGINLAAGALESIERRKLDLDYQLYGGTIHQEFLGAQWKAGYFLNHSNTDNLHLGQASWIKTWDNIFWTPSLIFRGEMNLEKNSLEQGIGDLVFHPFESIGMDVSYFSQKRNLLAPGSGEFLYRLFSLTNQKTWNGALTWSPTREFQTEVSGKSIRYTSQSKRESAEQAGISFTWTQDRYSASTTAQYLHSYGGKILHGGGVFKHSLSRWAALRWEADAAYTQKINRINSWAYHGRSGLEFRLYPRLLVSTFAEVERNHLFDLDARAIAYVSHYLY